MASIPKDKLAQQNLSNQVCVGISWQPCPRCCHVWSHGIIALRAVATRACSSISLAMAVAPHSKGDKAKVDGPDMWRATLI
jgi:hypothetical protein